MSDVDIIQITALFLTSMSSYDNIRNDMNFAFMLTTLKPFHLLQEAMRNYKIVFISRLVVMRIIRFKGETQNNCNKNKYTSAGQL